MKLYTEDQVRKSINDSSLYSYINGNFEFKYSEDDIINALTPIELPSDEEIQASLHPEDNPEQELYNDGWEDGIKWLRNKIQGGNK